jgi:hypothetical protein
MPQQEVAVSSQSTPQTTSTKPLTTSPSPWFSVRSTVPMKMLTPLVEKHASRFPALKSWDIFILTEPQWKEMRLQLGNQKTGKVTNSAFSILNAKRTYLRESHILRDPNSLPLSLAHEYWHLALDTEDEEKVNEKVRWWLKEQSKK